MENKNVCEICEKTDGIIKTGIKDKKSKELKEIYICKACFVELHSGNIPTHDKFMNKAKKLFND